jgi:hypothetical protein
MVRFKLADMCAPYNNPGFGIGQECDVGPNHPSYNDRFRPFQLKLGRTLSYLRTIQSQTRKTTHVVSTRDFITRRLQILPCLFPKDLIIFMRHPFTYGWGPTPHPGVTSILSQGITYRGWPQCSNERRYWMLGSTMANPHPMHYATHDKKSSMQLSIYSLSKRSLRIIGSSGDMLYPPPETHPWTI